MLLYSVWPLPLLMTSPAQDLHRFLSVLIFPTLSRRRRKVSSVLFHCHGYKYHILAWSVYDSPSAWPAALLHLYWFMCPFAVESTSAPQGSRGKLWPRFFIILSPTELIRPVNGNTKDRSPVASVCPAADNAGTYFMGLPLCRYFGTPREVKLPQLDKSFDKGHRHKPPCASSKLTCIKMTTCGMFNSLYLLFLSYLII